MINILKQKVEFILSTKMRCPKSVFSFLPIGISSLIASFYLVGLVEQFFPSKYFAAKTANSLPSPDKVVGVLAYDKLIMRVVCVIYY